MLGIHDGNSRIFKYMKILVLPSCILNIIHEGSGQGMNSNTCSVFFFPNVCA